MERLSGGEQVRIRRVRVSDEDALQDLLYRLSDESTFMRFFGQTRTHPHQEVLRLVELDELSSVALVACVADTDELIGIARADLDSRTGAAELGLTIADAWQGKGLGGILLADLTRAATAIGMTALIAEVLPANGRMQRALRHAGFLCTGCQPGPDPLTFRLSLQDREAS